MKQSTPSILPKRLLLTTFLAFGLSGACGSTEAPRPGYGDDGPSASSGGGTGSSRPDAPVDFGGGAGGEASVDALCGPAPASGGDFSKKALLAAISACTAHLSCELAVNVTDLGRAVTALSEEPTEDHLASARDAWVDAMLAWSLVGPLEYGPVAGVGTDEYHGRGIGAFVHPWPTPNRCEVTKQIVSRFYETEGMTRVPPGARGLYALEVILFGDDAESGCPPSSATAIAWAEMTAGERQDGKYDYAKAVVDDVFRRTEEITGVWAENGEDFGKTLTGAVGYGTEQEALNVVSWSLLYVYEAVRDGKVAPLAGVTTTLPNPETPHAGIDREAIIQNLESFQALFAGCDGGEGLGFDDWLAEAGHADLRDDILAALAVVMESADGLPPLHEATQAEMEAFYLDLKVLTDLLKGELLGSASPLNLELPAGAASDTD